jgi:hypothetical protein
MVKRNAATKSSPEQHDFHWFTWKFESNVIVILTYYPSMLPRSHTRNIFLSSSDRQTADSHLHEALATYKDVFDGILRFVPRGRNSTGKYSTTLTMRTFLAYAETVIKAHGLIPYKEPGEPEIICCRVRDITRRYRSPKPPPTKPYNSDRLEINVYPHHFEKTEDRLRARLKDLRETFHGRVILKSYTGFYAAGEQHVPKRIIEICRSLRILAAPSPKNNMIIEADFSKLLPKKESKPRKKKTKDPAQSAPVPIPKPKVPRPPSRASVSQPVEPVVPVQPDAQIQFQNFPESGFSSTEMLCKIDLQKDSLPTIHQTVWDALRWASQYPFLTLHFITGPVAKAPFLSDPRKRTQILNTIKLLEENEQIAYKWKIAEGDQNLIICQKRIT